MSKKQEPHVFLKMSGCKDMNSFYKKFPTEDHFFSKFPDAKLPPMKQGHMQMGGQWQHPEMMPPIHPGYLQMGGQMPTIMPPLYPVDAPVTMYPQQDMHRETGMKNGGTFQFGNWFQDGGYADSDGDGDMMKKGGWIKDAINPKHKGYCTPMTKSTCTPRRKAFAQTMKRHHGFHKQYGGPNDEQDAGFMGDSNQSAFSVNTTPPQNVSAQYNQQAAKGNPDPNAQSRQQNYSGNNFDQSTSTPPGAIPAYWGRTAANTLNLGITGANYFQQQKANKDVYRFQQEQGLSSNLPVQTQSFGHGYYDNQGNLPMNNFSQTPSAYAQMGGQYTKGGTYEMDETTMNDLIRKGYKLKKL